MASKSRIPATVVLLLAGIALGWTIAALTGSTSTAPDAADSEDAAPEIAPADMDVRVTADVARRGDLPRVLVAAGVVRAAPGSRHVIGTRAGGRVVEALAAPGQQVHAGEVLLRFDPAPLLAALAQARATLAAAAGALSEFEQTGRERTQVELAAAVERTAAQLVLAEAESARRESLHADGLASDKALAESRQAAVQARADAQLARRAEEAFRTSGAEFQHATLLAEHEAARAAAAEAERMLAEAQVTAPCDGQVVEFLARPGASFDPGAPLGELLSAEGRLLVFGVTADAARRLPPDAPAWWTDGLGRTHRGRLSHVAGTVDPVTGLVDAIVVPEEPDATPDGMPVDPQLPLPPGLAVRGELQLDLLRDALLVPERAVLRDRERQVVVIADGDHARIEPVTLAGRHGGQAAIEGNVRAGDLVLIDGGYNLPDGAHLGEVLREARGEGQAAADGGDSAGPGRAGPP